MQGFNKSIPTNNEDHFFEVERSLLQLDQITASEIEGCLLLTVREVGIWFVKFRGNSVLYNRRDLVLPDLIKPETHISFKSMGAFQHTILGGYEDELNQGNIEVHGHSQILTVFKNKCIKSGEISSTQSVLDTPMRQARLRSFEDEQPLKKGWLLKKRDIISGWKCRYFELFKGRLLYYREANDVQPRGVIFLAGAEVGKVALLKIKRTDHFGFIIEAKKPEKTVRIASERKGIDGKAEAESWCQALIYASDVHEVPGLDDKKGSSNNPTTKLFIETPNNNKGKNLSSKDKKKPLSPLTAAISPLSRRISLYGFTTPNPNSDDPVANTTTMILSATIIVILAVALHYTWAIKQWISTKLYVTFALLIFVLITIFCQEFLFMSSDDESGEKTNKSNTLVEESAKKPKDNTSPSNPNYNEADDDTENLSDSSSDDDES